MSNIYAPNNAVRMSVAFTVAGVATDPTAVSLTVRDPASVSTTYTYAAAQITKDSTGNYHKDVTVTTVGGWTFSFAGTGAVVAQGEGTFNVGTIMSP